MLKNLMLPFSRGGRVANAVARSRVDIAMGTLALDANRFVTGQALRPNERVSTP